MSPYNAVVDLLRTDLEWRRFFGKSCRESATRLRAVAFQVRGELAERGRRFTVEEIEDALLSLAREKLPESAGAKWDAHWASGLCREALSRLSGQYSKLSKAERKRLDLTEQDEWHQRMNAAGENNDPAAFREALAQWERAGLEAFDEARSKEGAVA
jgi:hypothetical protein